MAKDLIHEAVIEALQADGWIITDDPLIVPIEETFVKMDLGAERVIAAQRESEKIAVEIKTLNNPSIVYSFYEAFGQYLFYRDALIDQGIEREMYLGITDIAYNRLIKRSFIAKRIIQYQIKILVIDVTTKRVVKWEK